MHRAARSIAATLALTLVAAPAFAAGAKKQAAIRPEQAAAQPDRNAVKLSKIPEPHAPARQPLQMRRSDPFARGERFDTDTPAKESWFDDQGFRIDASGLAYKFRF